MYSSVLKLAAPAVNFTDLIIVEKVAYKNFIYSSESKHRLWLGLSVQYSKSEGLSQVPHKKKYIYLAEVFLWSAGKNRSITSLQINIPPSDKRIQICLFRFQGEIQYVEKHLN